MPKSALRLSDQGEKRVLVFELDQEKIGKNVIRLLQLSCNKNHAKKCFETITPASPGRSLRELSELKTSYRFRVGPGENGGNRRTFITAEM